MLASTIVDKALQHTLLFGIGIHHAGLASKDRSVHSVQLEQASKQATSD